jgi:carbonic anhydrase
MSHDCHDCVIYCMDWRLSPGQADLDKLLVESGIVQPGLDRVIVGGAAKNLASPTNQADIDFILRQIDISDRLHHVKKVVLINHSDCGAYGGSDKFATTEDEIRFHGEELMKAAKVIREKFPHLEVNTMIALLSSQGDKWQAVLM